MRRLSRVGSAAVHLIIVALASLLCGAASEQEKYDVVISQGRVMDPESGLDAVRNVGISGGKIRAIAEKELRGRETIEARGLVVAPGFIDLHQHGHEAQNYQFKARDGVTTSLELERGTDNVGQWYAAREGKTLINFGVSIGHGPVRMKVMKDPGAYLPTGDAAHRETTPGEQHQIESSMAEGLKAGALAVGMGLEYTVAASREEVLQIFRIAAAANAPIHVHLRYSGLKEPAGLAGLEEVIAAAAITGAPLHVVHITSMGLRDTPLLLSAVKGARERGMDVTTECYPYTAFSTGIESTSFDEGWQEANGITYKDLQWVKTGERLTAETFARYRKEGGFVVPIATGAPRQVVGMTID